MTRFRILHFLIIFPSRRKNYDEISSTFRNRFPVKKKIMTRFRVHFVIVFPSRIFFDEISSTFRNRFPVKKKL